MPTILESEKQEKPQLVQSNQPEPELFAAELAMEKDTFNFAPILLAVVMVVAIAGTIVYFVRSSREVISVSTANQVVSNILRAQASATKFSTGTVEPNNGLEDPLYRLLTKAGVVAAKPDKPKDATSLVVEVTGPGESLLSSIDGVKKTPRVTGGMNYAVPLAERKLISIDKITLVKPHLAKVDYTWKWVPNKLGEEFDASGSLVKNFSTWERSTLINSYGADFYGAEPTKTSILVAEGDDGVWRKFTEQ